MPTNHRGALSVDGLRPRPCFAPVIEGKQLARSSLQTPPMAAPSPQPPSRLMDRFRQACRLRHFSPRTEEAYASWIRRFIVFRGKRHPDTLLDAEPVGPPNPVPPARISRPARRHSRRPQSRHRKATQLLYRDGCRWTRSF